MVDIKTASWYPALLDDLLSTYIETQFTAREAAIERYHHWGHRISQEIENWGDLKYTPSQLYEQLAVDFAARKKRTVSKRSFYYALKFYQTFPRLEDFLAEQGKDLSWHKIVRQHLTESFSPLSDRLAQEENKVSAPGLAQFSSWYVDLVKSSPCCVCETAPADPHHFPKTKGAWAEDWRVIPLCRKCHGESHQDPKEFLWENRHGIFGWFYSAMLHRFAPSGKGE